MLASNLKPSLITKCFSGMCVRYAVLANAGLACASICQGRLLRLWFWKAWRLSLASNRRERGGREAVREAISRVLNLCEQDGYRLKAFQDTVLICFAGGQVVLQLTTHCAGGYRGHIFVYV